MANKESNIADLSAFDALTAAQEEGIELDILHPTTGKPIGLKLRVAGYESERAKKVTRALANKNVRGQRVKRITAEEAEENARHLQASVIVGWDWYALKLDGQVPEFNLANVKAVLNRFPFIAEQVDVLANDRAAFLEA